MSALERFTESLLKIEGVEYYVLTRRDGRLIAHNLDSPEDLASSVTLAGLSASAIQDAIGFSHFNHIVYGSGRGQGLLVFPLENFFLAVPTRVSPPPRPLIRDVSAFLQQLLDTKEKRSAAAGSSA